MFYWANKAFSLDSLAEASSLRTSSDFVGIGVFLGECGVCLFVCVVFVGHMFSLKAWSSPNHV